ncbi:MAG: dihydroorotase [Candidatus Tantalella remota]|nr:dihydroorotase [Candidatus Tantalella remota]
MSILIKNGHIIDPAQGIDKKGDILIEGDEISQIGGKIKKKADVEINAEGLIVAPGFIDLHSHLREPGGEEKETVESGLRAAVAGGFTTVCAMPNTDPPCDTRAQVEFLKNRAKETGLGTGLPVGAITKDRKGTHMTEMCELKEAGCLAVSDDGDSVEDSVIMRRALEYASMADLVVMSHCEDKELVDEGVMNEGYWSTVLGLGPIPGKAESIMVDRDIQLAELAGARLHIAHVSTAESVDIIRRAKARGVRVTAEVTPHHLTLSDEALTTYDTNLKVNPPLRSDNDIRELKKGLKDGTIDAIATDHAPHLENEKEREFNYAPFGMIGFETALPLVRKALIEEGHLSWPELISKLTVSPAKVLGYDRGSLAVGEIADIVLINPDKEWVYEKSKVQSKSSNSPFIGWTLKGAVEGVIIAGKQVQVEQK